MKYKPSRDIPQAAEELRSISPSKIAEWAREHRFRIKNGVKYQENVTVNAVSMWLNRNPAVLKKLEEDQKLRELDKVVITSGLFENGAFREIPSVKNFIMGLTNRGAKEATVTGWTNGLKRIMQGKIRTGEDIPDWGMKHPDKFDVEDAKAFLYEIKKRGYRSREWRLIIRAFLRSKGIVVDSTDISGELEEDAGKYADLFVAKDKIEAILQYIQTLNKIAYAVSKFAYKTATRLTACLTADWQFYNEAEETLTVFEKSERGKAKKRVSKYLPRLLAEEIQAFTGKKTGRMFEIDAQELNNICRTALKAIVPEIEPRIVRPFHFWRHMYAQHMLRASGWNLGMVGDSGNWSVEALQKYYGKADPKIVRAFTIETLSKI